MGDSICIRKKPFETGEHDPSHTQLPKRFRGRCHGPKFVSVQTHGPPKTGGVNQFSPLSDVCTLAATHKTRQVRRLESFLKNLEAAIANCRLTELEEHLHAEWRAIRSAPGYPFGFQQWAISTASSLWLVSLFSEGAIPWIQHLLEATRTDCQAYFRLARIKNFQDKIESDWKHFGGKSTCKLIRKTPAHQPAN